MSAEDEYHKKLADILESRASEISAIVEILRRMGFTSWTEFTEETAKQKAALQKTREALK